MSEINRDIYHQNHQIHQGGVVDGNVQPGIGEQAATGGIGSTPNMDRISQDDVLKCVRYAGVDPVLVWIRRAMEQD